MKTKIAVAVFVCLCAVIGALAWQEPVKLPPPFVTPSVNNGPRIVPKPEGATLHLPPGFHIEEYAEGFEVPRYMALGPRNEILLSDSAHKPNGTVYILDGKQRKKLIGGLDRPYGLAFWKDYLYVAETTSLKRYPYSPHAETVGAGEEVVPMPDFGAGHSTRTVLFSRDGSKMYVGVGSRSNVSPGEPPERAAINRYNPDGSGHEIIASGTRNPIGLRWYPGSDTLWASVQERDLLGDNLVPDYFTHIREGAFYGWPYAYIGPNEDPRNKGQKPALVAKTIVPDSVLEPSHVAVMDFVFYTGEQFPAEYRGGAFLAFHGSWNRAKRVGYSLAFIPFKDGKPSGAQRDFITGWMLSPESREVWGRPVGLLQLPDGSLLLSDDGGRKVWHIFYKAS